jgi:hypothetical protein
MDHLLDLEWTVVDEMDAALAGVDSPDPARNTPARSPHKEPRGTTASSRNAADDTARAQTPALDRSDVKDTSEEVCDGVAHEEWMAPLARVLMLEVRRPRTLPRRLPDPHAAILFALWDDGAAVPRLPLSAAPGRPPNASRPPPPTPEHPKLPEMSSDPGASAVPAVRPPPATTPPSPWLTQIRRQPENLSVIRII